MNVHQFITTGQERWKSLDAFITRVGQLSLAKAPLDDFKAGALAYRQTASDLAYARMRFPNHSVVKELEKLVARAHSVVYQAKRVKRGDWRTFWLRTWPTRIVEARREIGFATALFWGAALVGFALASRSPVLESFFISEPMRQAMNEGHLWTEGITAVAPQASSRITTNNISVCILAWVAGVTFGIGTFLLVVFNGLILGVVFAGCLRAGLFLNIAEFVTAHGALELPAIFIAAGAGFMLGNALIFPGRYSRAVELKRAGKRSMEIVIGVIPMLLIAGFVEGFVSPSNLPASIKITLAVSLFVAYLAYIISCAKPEESSPTYVTAPQSPLR